MLMGLYKMKFKTGGDEGAGVCLFKDGRIAGGGSIMYYVGEYQMLDASRFIASIVARRHGKKNKPSPVLGLEEFHMHMEGVFSGPYAQLVGHIIEVPNAILIAKLELLANF